MTEALFAPSPTYGQDTCEVACNMLCTWVGADTILED
jgi:hypothetical protein